MVLSGFGKILKVPHNLEVVSSNPAPATYKKPRRRKHFDAGAFFHAPIETPASIDASFGNYCLC